MKPDLFKTIKPMIFGTIPPFYLLAGAQTSIHSLVHAFHEMHNWLKDNPERKSSIKNDPIFILQG